MEQEEYAIGTDDESRLEQYKKQDRLLTSMFRNRARHISANRKKHVVDKKHNCATMYFYVPVEPNEFGLKRVIQTHKIFHKDSLTYKQWETLVAEEVASHEMPEGTFYYGWHTHYIKTEYIRAGDIMLTIDENGIKCALYVKVKTNRGHRLYARDAFTYKRKVHTEND